jgi:16S rRNA (cytosine1402-N4)-methyltransferase
MPVAVREAFSMPTGLILDATAGGGGHTEILLELGHSVVAMDRDPLALERIRLRHAAFVALGRLRLEHGDFASIGDLSARLGPFDGILADLGLSSDQLADPTRGFSFESDAPADMRMDPDLPETAADLVERLPPNELARILREYGEERGAGRIARRIAGKRFESSRALAEAVKSAAGVKQRGPGRHRIHPATQTFQALRIAVNDELGQIRALLDAAPRALRPDGRIGIISFHSLEDRLVKHTFANWAGRCTCPPGLPVCGCGAESIAFPLWKGMKNAELTEIEANPRSRSARFRVMVMR